MVQGDVTMSTVIDRRIHKIGYDPETTSSEMPVNWDAVDLDTLDKRDAHSVRRASGKPDSFTAIYPSIMEVSGLNPRIVERDDSWVDEFRFRRGGFPPILIRRTVSGRIQIADGNHRANHSDEKIEIPVKIDLRSR